MISTLVGFTQSTYTLYSFRLNPHHACLNSSPCFHPGFANDYRDESVESLLLMRCVLENPDNAVLYKTCSELTKVRPSANKQRNTG